MADKTLEDRLDALEKHAEVEDRVAKLEVDVDKLKTYLRDLPNTGHQPENI